MKNIRIFYLKISFLVVKFSVYLLCFHNGSDFRMNTKRSSVSKYLEELQYFFPSQARNVETTSFQRRGVASTAVMLFQLCVPTRLFSKTSISMQGESSSAPDGCCGHPVNDQGPVVQS